MCTSTPKIQQADAAAPPPAPPADAPEAPVINENTPTKSGRGNRGLAQFRIPLKTNQTLSNSTGVNLPS